MLFHSFDFVLFFGIVFPTYFLLGKLPRGHRAQNGLLLVASYFFYGYWDARFLSLIVFSTVLDFVVGACLGAGGSPARRKTLLVCSVAGNLGVLATFKYLDFFIESAVALLGTLHLQPNWPTLNVILPVGISFYTFQTLSYTIDIYRGRIQPTRNLLDFALFVGFFPQLVAGPIERARTLLPQIARPRHPRPEQLADGLHLVLWGLFKKVFVADGLARIVDPVFAGETAASGPDLLLVLYAFALQIYGDFSGYTDIARGLCKLMGFELMLNFRLPYFAVNPSDLWERWHISLSSWLRDYLYIPLGGNRHGKARTYRNLNITMLLGGLWHGAAWTFVTWGAFHGALLTLSHKLGLARRVPRSPIRWLVAVLTMFHLTCLGWLVFRAESLGQAGGFLLTMTRDWSVSPETATLARQLLAHGWLLVVIQCFQHTRNDLMWIRRQDLFVQATFYMIVLFHLLDRFGRSAQEFIYFQF